MSETQAATSDDLINPEAAIAPGFLVNHAAQGFNRLADTLLRPHGMSLALIGPILLLSWKGPMLQRDMVRWSAVKQPALVAMLDKLEAKQLITRAEVPGDRRAATVSLTQAGAAMALVGRQVMIDLNVRGIRGLSADEAATLVSLLQRFTSNLSP